MAKKVNMSGVCLVLLCGLPAAGKTYLSRSLLSSRTTSKALRYIIVEYDRLLPASLEKILIEEDDHRQLSWKQYRSEIVMCVDSLISQIVESKHSVHSIDLTKHSPNNVDAELWCKFSSMVAEAGLDNIAPGEVVCIVIDDNMYYRSMRYSYYQLARKYTTGFCEVYLQADLETVITQNSVRDVKVTDDVIVAMATKMEAPDKFTYSWEENSISLSRHFDIEDVRNLIRKAAELPVQPIEEPDYELQAQSRLVCSENFLYQSDIIIRKLVSKQMAVAKENKKSKSEMKMYANTTQSIRKHLLADLKSGSLVVPSDLITMATDASNDVNSDLFRFLEGKFVTYFKEIDR